MRVVVDEAHATGCVGAGRPRRGRRGRASSGEVDVVVGTLGKALGSYGAFVACDAELVALLTNTARSLIFSTAPPPPAIAGALAALEVLEEQPRRVERLQANAEVLRDELAREGFDVAGSTTQIVPLIVGDAATAMRVCEAALERGVFAQAIRPPTVPAGTSRLRLAVMASHTKDELRDAARVLGRAALQAGFRPATAMPVARRPHAGACADARRLFDAEAHDALPAAPRAARRLTRWPRAAASSPAPTPASARRSSPRRSCAALRARGRAGRGVQAGRDRDSTSPPGEWPRRPRAARRGHRARARTTSRRGRFGPAVSPHLAAELAGDDDLARRARRRRGARRARRRRRSSSRASAGCSCRSAPSTTSATSPSRSACRSSSPRGPGLGTINHTLLTIEAARAAGLDVRAVVLTPVAGRADDDGALQPRDDRARAATSRSRRCARVRDVDDLAAAGATLAVGRWLGGGSI